MPHLKNTQTVSLEKKSLPFYI